MKNCQRAEALTTTQKIKPKCQWAMTLYWLCIALILSADAYQALYFWTNQTRSADLVGGYAGAMNLILGLIAILLMAVALMCLAIAAFKHRSSRGRYFIIGLGSLAAIALSSHLVDLILRANVR